MRVSEGFDGVRIQGVHWILRGFSRDFCRTS